MESLVICEELLAHVVVVTVLLSILLHRITANTWARRFGNNSTNTSIPE